MKERDRLLYLSEVPSKSLCQDRCHPHPYEILLSGIKEERCLCILNFCYLISTCLLNCYLISVLLQEVPLPSLNLSDTSREKKKDASKKGEAKFGSSHFFPGTYCYFHLVLKGQSSEGRTSCWKNFHWLYSFESSQR